MVGEWAKSLIRAAGSTEGGERSETRGSRRWGHTHSWYVQLTRGSVPHAVSWLVSVNGSIKKKRELIALLEVGTACLDAAGRLGPLGDRIMD